MRMIHKARQVKDLKIDKKDVQEESFADKQRKEKIISVLVFALIIIITVAFMLILFNI